MLRKLFYGENTTPRKIVEIKLNKEFNILDGDYIMVITYYGLIVHNGNGHNL